MADALFDALMHKIKMFYVQKKNAKVEAKGQRYELVDFVIKVGSVVLGQSTTFKGVLVEVGAPAVEFYPCNVQVICMTYLWMLQLQLTSSILW